MTPVSALGVLDAAAFRAPADSVGSYTSASVQPRRRRRRAWRACRDGNRDRAFDARRVVALARRTAVAGAVARAVVRDSSRMRSRNAISHPPITRHARPSRRILLDHSILQLEACPRTP